MSFRKTVCIHCVDHTEYQSTVWQNAEILKVTAVGTYGYI